MQLIKKKHTRNCYWNSISA